MKKETKRNIAIVIVMITGLPIAFLSLILIPIKIAWELADDMIREFEAWINRDSK